MQNTLGGIASNSHWNILTDSGDTFLVLLFISFSSFSCIVATFQPQMFFKFGIETGFLFTVKKCHERDLGNNNIENINIDYKIRSYINVFLLLYIMYI